MATTSLVDMATSEPIVLNEQMTNIFINYICPDMVTNEPMVIQYYLYSRSHITNQKQCLGRLSTAILTGSAQALLKPPTALG